MACACKAKKSGQVTAVKQVVKSNVAASNRAAVKKSTSKRLVVRRPVF